MPSSAWGGWIYFESPVEVEAAKVVLYRQPLLRAAQMWYEFYSSCGGEGLRCNVLYRRHPLNFQYLHHVQTSRDPYFSLLLSKSILEKSRLYCKCWVHQNEKGIVIPELSKKSELKSVLIPDLSRKEQVLLQGWVERMSLKFLIRRDECTSDADCGGNSRGECVQPPGTSLPR